MSICLHRKDQPEPVFHPHVLVTTTYRQHAHSGGMDKQKRFDQSRYYLRPLEATAPVWRCDFVRRMQQFHGAFRCTCRTLQFTNDFGNRCDRRSDNHTIKTKAANSPPLIRPSITSIPPTQSISPTAPSTRIITMVTSNARCVIRCFATVKASST